MSTRLLLTEDRLRERLPRLRLALHPATAAPPRPANLPGAEGTQAHLCRIVRRALRGAAEASSLNRRIHALACRVAGPDWDRGADREAVVRQVARGIGRLLNLEGAA